MIRAADGVIMTPMSATDTLPGAAAPHFDVAVPRNGYRWWYVDGLSDDNRSGIVVIAFVGSVFSPYYFSARRRGHGDPEDHCAINVGLYRPSSKLWAMTERSRHSLARSDDRFQVGPSDLRWDGDKLEIRVRERSAPFARRVEGRIVVRPRLVNDRALALDAGGRHLWQPLAPLAHIDVDFRRPEWRWQGDAYFDTNAGQRALEDDFRCWNWSRSAHGDDTAITYAVTQTDGAERSFALRFAADGQLQQQEVPPSVPLPQTLWRVARETRSHCAATLARTLEDTPFYSRSLLSIADGDAARLYVHESLALDRFCAPWVRTLLPFRMPRVR